MNAVTSTSSLSARAMVVSLKVSQWSGRRLDREITDEVNQQHNAAADAGRYNKLLLPKEALEPIEKVVSETRNEFTRRTLPWIDNGGRIMAADGYFAHATWINGQRAKFEAAVDEFITKYPGYVADARVRLNGMFKDEDYPTEDELRRKFGMDVKVMPVPSASDFRVEMSEAQAEHIRAEIEANVAAATKSAVSDIYRRIADMCERMVDRLNAYKPSSKKGEKPQGIFRDSLVGNVADLIDLLPTLNITGDPELYALADKLRPLVQYKADALREDEGKRRDVAAEAKAVLDHVSGFLA